MTPLEEHLMDIVMLALLDHQRVNPHHTDSCELCGLMMQAIAKAEGR